MINAFALSRYVALILQPAFPLPKTESGAVVGPRRHNIALASPTALEKTPRRKGEALTRKAVARELGR